MQSKARFWIGLLSKALAAAAAAGSAALGGGTAMSDEPGVAWATLAMPIPVIAMLVSFFSVISAGLTETPPRAWDGVDRRGDAPRP